MVEKNNKLFFIIFVGFILLICNLNYFYEIATFGESWNNKKGKRIVLNERTSRLLLRVEPRTTSRLTQTGSKNMEQDILEDEINFSQCSNVTLNDRIFPKEPNALVYNYHFKKPSCMSEFDDDFELSDVTLNEYDKDFKSQSDISEPELFDILKSDSGFSKYSNILGNCKFLKDTDAHVKSELINSSNSNYNNHYKVKPRTISSRLKKIIKKHTFLSVFMLVTMLFLFYKVVNIGTLTNISCFLGFFIAFYFGFVLIKNSKMAKIKKAQYDLNRFWNRK
ncbi:hypothetical protein MKS88_001728 [Plasmodium brasilianum]|uniref:Pv-fam-d protein n=2 Tax=Plasmodium (Plasmodium) TaxID=418103 RepID=A0A1A8X124_PLAMA|nr:Plasmodium exported protein, unknown function [Plasmodium malariae]KAI4839825.1 hypothetical protein MKS88_001728 [Plasmodium brasilianum]SBS98938.1 hypothetical protein PMALA_066170 [Plasmodium malariae]SBT86770.1 Plasmodium exported protein, unknown function [Plasmodium malariae]